MSTLEFNQMVVKQRLALEYFAQHLTANSEDAKDLFQETVLKAFRYRERFKEKTNLKAWLYTIMKNIFINNYRRSQRSKVVLDHSVEAFHLYNSRDSGSNSPDVVYSTSEIYQKIEQLDDTYRIPFERHREGYKYQEIAEELALPIGTVKSRIFLARKQLMEALPAYAK